MEKTKKTSVTLFERQIDWCEKKSINLSKFIRNLMDKEIRRGD